MIMHSDESTKLANELFQSNQTVLNIFQDFSDRSLLLKIKMLPKNIHNMQRPTHIDTTTTHLTDARKKYYANLNNSMRTGSLSTIYVKHLNALKLSHSECALSLSLATNQCRPLIRSRSFSCLSTACSSCPK